MSEPYIAINLTDKKVCDLNLNGADSEILLQLLAGPWACKRVFVGTVWNDEFEYYLNLASKGLRGWSLEQGSVALGFAIQKTQQRLEALQNQLRLQKRDEERGF